MSASVNRVISVLERSLERVKGGWTKRVSARNAEGVCVSVRARTATCFCATGAVEASTRSDDLVYDVLEELNASLPPYWRSDYSRGAVQLFNDQPKRTKRDIVALFTRTIKRLKAK